jgi:hypothetical protein
MGFISQEMIYNDIGNKTTIAQEGSMQKKLLIPSLAVVASMAAGLACNFPFITATSTPTQIIFPTPDLTMTAVFNPTITSLPVIPAATSQPTATDLPPAEVTASSTPVPTSTSIPPTATSTVTATTSYVGPGMRSKFGMRGVYFSTAPTIDGSLEEWNLDRYRIETVVFGKNNYEGIEDISGRAMIGWDSKKLYLGIRVLDDRYVQYAKGADIFKGDSLDILLDTDVSTDYYLGSLNGDDFQIGISPGRPAPNDEQEAYLWFPKGDEGKVDGATIAARSKEDGYVVEASIPWSVFDVDPEEGQHFGFAFSISDNDNRQQSVQQSMVSFVPIRTLSDPRTWGDLTLVKP